MADNGEEKHFAVKISMTALSCVDGAIQSGNFLHCTPMTASVWLHRSKAGHSQGRLWAKAER
ncbi:MAG: hypothetical protein V7761_06975 [Amylibacter sp.]